MKTYRIWLKDGQSFEIKANDVWRNGNEIDFIDNQREDIAVFNLDNISGWAETAVILREDSDAKITKVTEE